MNEHSCFRSPRCLKNKVKMTTKPLIEHNISSTGHKTNYFAVVGSGSDAKVSENQQVLRFSAGMIEWLVSSPTTALGLCFCLVMTRKPRTRTIRGQAMTVSFESLKHDRMSFFVRKSVDLPL